MNALPPQGGVSPWVLGLAAFVWLAGSLPLCPPLLWLGAARQVVGILLVSGLLSLLAAWLVSQQLQKRLLPTRQPLKPPAAPVSPKPSPQAPAVLLQAAPAPGPSMLIAQPSASSSTELLATLSQEFRTPLNGILGMSGFLLEEDLNPDSRHFSRSIEQSAETLLAIVNDILDFSKLEAGQMELEPLIFNPRHTVEDVLATVAPKAAARHLELFAHFQAAVPEWVEGDPGCIRQVLLNLVRNAITFTERGEVALSLSLAADGRLLFEVMDTGVGIADDTLQRLFHPHTQASSSASRRSAGSGLGLSISRTLVEMMGGEIGVESRVGEGSRFWFTAELKHCLGPGPGPDPKAPLLVAVPDRFGPKVLLAGPAIGSLRVLETHLKELGVDLRRCGGAETLDAGTVRGFDLVILAPEGPDLDGLLARAQNLRQAGAPPLVLFSTYVQRGQARLALQAGFAGFLCRPLQFSHVQNVLTGVLQKHPFLITRHQFEERQVSSGGRVLVVEARLDARQQSCRLLQKAGWKPYWTEGGQAALNAIQQRVFDFVLMDCSQPEFGGIEATRLLRAGGIKVPIIGLITATADAEQPEIRAAGLNATLTKPLRPADLTAIMERFRHRV